MSLEQKIENLRKDTAGWRLKVQQLLRYHSERLPEKDVNFLESLSHRTWLDELSFRQAEWLLDIESSQVMTTSHRGYSVRLLISACYQNRSEFEDNDRTWIEKLYSSGLMTVRRFEARRAYALAKTIGEVDDWAA